MTSTGLAHKSCSLPQSSATGIKARNELTAAANRQSSAAGAAVTSSPMMMAMRSPNNIPFPSSPPPPGSPSNNVNHSQSANNLINTNNHNASSRIPTRVSRENIKIINATMATGNSSTSSSPAHASPHRSSNTNTSSSVSSSPASAIPVSPNLSQSRRNRHNKNQSYNQRTNYQQYNSVPHQNFITINDEDDNHKTLPPPPHIETENILNVNECVTPRTQPSAEISGKSHHHHHHQLVAAQSSSPVHATQNNQNNHQQHHHKKSKQIMRSAPHHHNQHHELFDSGYGNHSSPALASSYSGHSYKSSPLHHQPHHRHHHPLAESYPYGGGGSGQGPKFEYFLMTGDHILNLTGKSSYPDTPTNVNRTANNNKRVIPPPSQSHHHTSGRRDTFVLAGNSLPTSPINNLDGTHQHPADHANEDDIADHLPEDPISSSPCQNITYTLDDNDDDEELDGVPFEGIEKEEIPYSPRTAHQDGFIIDHSCPTASTATNTTADSHHSQRRAKGETGDLNGHSAEIAIDPLMANGGALPHHIPAASVSNVNSAALTRASIGSNCSTTSIGTTTGSMKMINKETQTQNVNANKSNAGRKVKRGDTSQAALRRSSDSSGQELPIVPSQQKSPQNQSHPHTAEMGTLQSTCVRRHPPIADLSKAGDCSVDRDSFSTSSSTASASSSSSNCSKDDSSYVANIVNDYPPPSPLLKGKNKKGTSKSKNNTQKRLPHEGQKRDDEGYALLKNLKAENSITTEEDQDEGLTASNSNSLASQAEETDLSCATDAILCSSNASNNNNVITHHSQSHTQSLALSQQSQHSQHSHQSQQSSYRKTNHHKTPHNQKNHKRQSKRSPNFASATLPVQSQEPTQTESSMSEGYSLVSSISGMGALFAQLPPSQSAGPAKSASFTSRTQQSLSLTSSFDSDESLTEEVVRKKQQKHHLETDPEIARLPVPSQKSLIDPSSKEPSPGRSTKSSTPTTQILQPPIDAGLEEEDKKYEEDEWPEEALNDDDETDSESLPVFQPKAVDASSATRLAKRLYHLEGFKKSDVSRHLSKTNEFTRFVAEEYMKYFDFSGDTLDTALHQFLARFDLIGETVERERVLQHFSKRFMDFHPHLCHSQDALHTLTCGILLLNSDLHNESLRRKMTLQEFVDNLSDLNDGDNFDRRLLSNLYESIKSRPIESLSNRNNVDSDYIEGSSVRKGSSKSKSDSALAMSGNAKETLVDLSTINPFLGIPDPNCGNELKNGWISRKSCCGPAGKRTPKGKRSWRMFYSVLRDLTIYFHKDETCVKTGAAPGQKGQSLYETLNNAVRIHHSMVTRAEDYSKRSNVFRLITADRSEYLFQASSPIELENWMIMINYSAASLSAPPLAAPMGSRMRQFQRPVLPSSHTKLELRAQLADHISRAKKFEMELEKHLHRTPDRGAPRRLLDEFVEKQNYLHHELLRYKLYVSTMKDRHPELMDFSASAPNLNLQCYSASNSRTSSSGNVSNMSNPSSVPSASPISALNSRISIASDVIGEENSDESERSSPPNPQLPSAVNFACVAASS